MPVDGRATAQELEDAETADAAAFAAIAARVGSLEAGGGGAIVTETPDETVVLDLSTGSNKRLVQVESDTALAITGDTDTTTLLVVVIETGAGGSAVTWWDGINWGAGSAPTVTTAANKRDVFSLLRLGAGDWLGFVVGQALDVPIVPEVPDAPTGATATAGNAQADVVFTPGSNNGSARTGCRITPRIAGVAQTPQVFSTTATTQTVTGLTNGTAYTFTVEDKNGVGYSAPSTASNSVTPAALTVPGSPTSVAGTRGNAQVSVAFTPPVSNGGSAITGYTVTVSPGSHTASGASSPIVVTGLTNGTAYTATVHATNAQGDSAESSPSSSFTPATFAGAPTIGVATAGDTIATANWTAPGSNGGAAVTGYQVKTYAAADDTLLDTDTVGNVLTFGQTGLTNGVGVYFKVAAINAVGTGAQSAASNTVTPAASGGPFDFAGLFTKGAFNVDDITGASDGDPISPWVDASALALNFAFDGDWGAGTTPIYKTGIVSGKPVLRCVGPNLYRRNLSAPIPQPFTVLWVGRNTNGGAQLLSNNSAAVQLVLGGSLNNYLRMGAGNASGGPCADLSVGFHYVVAVFDGASSLLRVDGSVVTFDGGSPGTNGLSNETFLPGNHSVGGDPDLRAYGVAPIHPSSGQITAIEAFAASLL